MRLLATLVLTAALSSAGCLCSCGGHDDAYYRAEKEAAAAAKPAGITDGWTFSGEPRPDPMPK
jgi:hypothetical protein